MRQYRQLTDEDRIEIYAMKQAGKQQNIIAAHIGVHPATISRELSRNSGLRGYRPKQAQQKALHRRYTARKAVKMTPKTIDYTECKLLEEHSPEQISKRNYTLTLDNGKEFARHESVAKKLKIRVYFADPYSPWQRGLNENTNGLIRQYVPKGSDIRTLTDEQIEHIMDRLNNRPRKSLGYLTPNEIYYKRKLLTE
jgi:IS30 family transposase